DTSGYLCRRPGRRHPGRLRRRGAGALARPQPGGSGHRRRAGDRRGAELPCRAESAGAALDAAVGTGVVAPPAYRALALASPARPPPLRRAGTSARHSPRGRAPGVAREGTAPATGTRWLVAGPGV